MKRRSSSRPARSARPSSQRQRSGTGRRSLGPLLRLALPVLATALTLGSLLINVMAGGFTTTQGVTAWALTGVSALVCAFAWWTYVAASAAEKKKRAAEPPYPGVGEGFDAESAYGYGDGYDDADRAAPEGPAHADEAAYDAPADGAYDGPGGSGETTAVWNPPPSGGAAESTAVFSPGDTGGPALGDTGGFPPPADAAAPPVQDAEHTIVGARWDATPSEPDSTPLPPPGPAPSSGPAPTPPLADPPAPEAGDTGGFPTIPAPPYSTPYSGGPSSTPPSSFADDPLSGPAPASGPWRPAGEAAPREERTPWASNPTGGVNSASDILGGGPAPGQGAPPADPLGGPSTPPNSGTVPRYPAQGVSHYPGYRGDLFADHERRETGPDRREDGPWPYPPPPQH